jgi:hypothetical protein
MFLLLISFTYSYSAFASDTIKVHIKGLRIRLFKVIITGNIKGKGFVTLTHLVRDGKDSIFSMDASLVPLRSDTLQIVIKQNI